MKGCPSNMTVMKTYIVKTHLSVCSPFLWYCIKRVIRKSSAAVQPLRGGKQLLHTANLWTTSR